MTENPFRPPSADVEDPRRGKGSAIKGIALGLLVDTAGSIVLSIAVTVVYGVATAAAGHSEQEIGASLMNADSDPVLSAALLAVGVLSSVLGGYVCERIARHGSYWLGAILSALSIAVGFALGGGQSPAVMIGLLMFLAVGSVLLGTRLAFQARDAAPQR